jgi:hypothetical protein
MDLRGDMRLDGRRFKWVGRNLLFSIHHSKPADAFLAVNDLLVEAKRPPD